MSVRRTALAATVLALTLVFAAASGAGPRDTEMVCCSGAPASWPTPEKNSAQESATRVGVCRRPDESVAVAPTYRPVAIGDGGRRVVHLWGNPSCRGATPRREDLNY